MAYSRKQILLHKRKDNRRRYNERLQKGLCPHCGGRRDDGWILCVACRQERRDYHHGMTREQIRRKNARCRERRIADGKCISCGRPWQNEKYKTCDICRARRRYHYHNSYKHRKILENAAMPTSAG